VEIFSVSIKEPEPEEKPAPKTENKIKKNTKTVQSRKEKGVSVNDDWREETVDLGSLDIKYVSYLAKIKNKILQIWKYPQKAYEKNEEGNVIVKMSIDADGRLAGAALISSSGYAELDDGALSVVQTAAPFEPLPVIYDLSRLNIVASFQYKITD
jgi:protein TonB